MRQYFTTCGLVFLLSVICYWVLGPPQITTDRDSKSKASSPDKTAQSPNSQRPANASVSTEGKLRASRLMLQEPDDAVRLQAIHQMMELGSDALPASEDIALVLQKDKVPSVRAAAATALGQIYLRGMSGAPDQQAILSLTHALEKDEDSVVRWHACEAVGNIGRLAHQAAPTLLDAMQAKDDHMRSLARRAFRLVVGPECAALSPKLIAMHRKGIGDPELEFTILIALGRISANETEVVPVLIQVINRTGDDSHRLRAAATSAIQAMGPKAKNAVPCLMEALEESIDLDKSDPRNIRLPALAALRSIGPDATPAVALLSSIISGAHYDRKTRIAAENALKAITQGQDIIPQHTQ